MRPECTSDGAASIIGKLECQTLTDVHLMNKEATRSFLLLLGDSVILK
jgi:hypothetical protein